jgi:DNA-binding GntR family transcriptional regulator
MIIEGESISIEEKIYRALEEDILRGRLASGEGLREMALAARFESSRTPVRSALHRLAEDGLVVLNANRGATVVGITNNDIDDIYAMRMRLEGLASRLAAERMTPEGKAELSSVVHLSEMYCKNGDDVSGSEMDSRFHKMIYEASGSRHLCKTLSELHRNIKACRASAMCDKERARRSITEHREILEAIIAGNGDEAERLTAVHISNALMHFKKNQEV